MMNFLNNMLINMSLKAKNFLAEEEGDVNIVSIVVLIGIAVILAIAFKDAIGNLLTDLFGSIGNSADEVTATVAAFN